MPEDHPDPSDGSAAPASAPTAFTDLIHAGGAAPDAVAPPRRRIVPLLALVLAVVALVLACIPYACFAAGLPALAAIVLAFVGLIAPGRRALAVAALVTGAVALVVAVTVSVVQISGAVGRFASGAGALVSQLPGGDATPVPGLAAGAHRVTYAVAGDGSASISYSALVDGVSGVDREADVAVPHQRVQRLTVQHGGGTGRFVMVVIARDVSKPLRCSIAIDGRTVDTRVSAASSGTAFVTCTARTGT